MAKDNNSEEKIKNALIKKAVGYDFEEVVEEYDVDENKIALLSKKKVSKKHFPPDLASIKILLAFYMEKSTEELESMTDEELKKERDKLLLLLKEGSQEEKG